MKALQYKFIFCLIIVFNIKSTEIVYGQISVYYDDDAVSDTIFNIKNEEKLPWKPFDFPGFNVHPEKSKGVLIVLSSSDSIYKLDIRKNRKIGEPSDTITFFARLYTKNIKKVIVSGLNGDDINTITEIKFRRNGYQWAIEQDINSTNKDVKIPDFLCFEVIRMEPSEQASFYIGDLWIGVRKQVKKVIPSSFFMNSPFDNYKNFREENYDKSSFNSLGIYDSFPINYYDEAFSTNLTVESSLDKYQLITGILNACIENYPFYKEKNLNKKNVVSDFNRLIEVLNSEDDFCSFIKKLNDFLLMTFYDPHFKITPSKGCDDSHEYSRGPIRLYPIDKKFKVAAVLDKGLVDVVPLDSELLTLEGTPFTDIIKSSAIDEKNNYLFTVNRLMANRKLYGKVNDTIDLTFLKPDGIIEDVKYSIKKQYAVPHNFRIKNGTFSIINDTISYIKFNHILRDVPSIFASNLEKINKHKNLIIDLRGNSGGESEEGARLLSYLIPRNFVFTKFIDRKSGNIDSTVVKKNSVFSYRDDGNILVLIDENTASAAELFTYVLKKNRERVLLVGRSPTMGAIIPTYRFYLPKSGAQILSSSPSPIKYVFDNQIEDYGIKPDVLVPLKSVNDLQPYEDKVLKKGIEYLKKLN
ncbi:S41 family peptidase [Sinomicrobium oceani]|uniref:S41 family peptidase n=1 Tax=Sinomicrobium oceani TaxID=1150368 RepID=UPI00227D0541|nr:S41 family peptidase [Sinomicrobium oceani]